MGYTLKLWVFDEKDGWLSEYDPVPETLEDARSLANWWILHRKEKEVEVQILQRGEVVERYYTKDGKYVINEGRAAI